MKAVQFNIIHRGAQWLLTVYVMLLGLLLLHPLMGEELHGHSDHVCPTETHYHQAEVDCQICHFSFTSADSIEPYTLDLPHREVVIQLYTALNADIITNTLVYHHLRGPPIV